MPLEVSCCESQTDVTDLLIQAIVQFSLADSSQQLQQIVQRTVRQLVNSDGASIILNDGDNCYYVDEDAISALWKGKRFPKMSCISGWSMSHKEQVAITDIFADNRIPHNLYSPTFVKSLVMTPVRKVDPVAAIGVYWAHLHTASEEQLKALQIMADVMATAIQNVEYRNNLEQIVKQRTDDLAQSRDELKHLAYVVSHELQEPLQTLNGELNLLKTRYVGRLGSDANHYIGSALSSSGRISRMLDALWLYARVEKSSLLTAEISSREVFERSVQKLSDVVGSCNAQITATELPVVTANRAQLEYLFQELLENALKFNNAKPAIHVNCQRKDADWIFSVEDNGIGFNMIDANSIYTMFKQLDKGRAIGSGMGLAVCKRIVEAHGGNLWANSSPSIGSTFYFTLPA